MKKVIRITLLTALVACGVPACSAETGEPAPSHENGTQQQAVVAEIPARSNVLGATVWRFSRSDSGGRAWAVDADGNVVADFDLTVVEKEVTIASRLTGEHIVTSTDGRLIDSTMPAGSTSASLLSAIASDVQLYRQENTDVPHDCNWDFVSMWAWCTAMFATCNHLFGWACVGVAANCGDAAGDFYFNCLAPAP